MQISASDQARADLEQWAQEAHENVLGIADMLNVPAEQYEQDVLILIGPLQDYVSRLPLDEFEQDDWFTLHSDLAAYVADVGIHEHGASWKVLDDETSPSGFRYVIEGAALGGEVSSVDPFDVVMEEFGNLPIQIARMLANAEVAIGVNPLI